MDDRPADGPEALVRLMAANRRFASGTPTNDGRDARRRETTSTVQAPLAVVLACADSRLSPEIIFDQGIGDLFVVRVAGNTAAAPEIQGSIEYGVAELHARLVVVLGHEACGAVKAALAAVTDGATYPGQIGSLVEPIVPAVQRTADRPVAGQLPAAVVENVRAQLAVLRQLGPILSPAIDDGSVLLVGATYALASGEVTLLD
jgi:carbonic anhydrase